MGAKQEQQRRFSSVPHALGDDGDDGVIWLPFCRLLYTGRPIEEQFRRRLADGRSDQSLHPAPTASRLFAVFCLTSGRRG